MWIFNALVGVISSATKWSRDTKQSFEPEGESDFNRFLRFGPLCGPPVEMTKAQILITIRTTKHGQNFCEGDI
jgi:hypothetical protein